MTGSGNAGLLNLHRCPISLGSASLRSAFFFLFGGFLGISSTFIRELLQRDILLDGSMVGAHHQMTK
jgi:hypothetical protein